MKGESGIFSRFDIFFAFLIGAIAGMTETPWPWETYATVGVFLVYIIVKSTREEA